MHIFWHQHPQKYHPHPQLSSNRRPSRWSLDSIQSYHQQRQQCTLFCHGLKNVSARGMRYATSDTWVIIPYTYRMVNWFPNWNWKSTFIKHEHYALLTTLERRVSIRPSAFTATREVVSASVHRRVKSPQGQSSCTSVDASAHFWWSFIIPHTCNTTQRKCALKPQLMHI